MAAKTANVLARVEPEVKAQAEEIMNELGIPASVVINMLYKQIIFQRRIPFESSLPLKPLAKQNLTQEEFNIMLETGLKQAERGELQVAEDVFDELKDEAKTWKKDVTA